MVADGAGVIASRHRRPDRPLVAALSTAGGRMTLFKKRPAETHTDAEREVLLKLLADEEAKEPPLKNGILKPR
jgi:hypothetical protein